MHGIFTLFFFWFVYYKLMLHCFTIILFYFMIICIYMISKGNKLKSSYSIFLHSFRLYLSVHNLHPSVCVCVCSFFNFYIFFLGFLSLINNGDTLMLPKFCSHFYSTEISRIFIIKYGKRLKFCAQDSLRLNHTRLDLKEGFHLNIETLNPGQNSLRHDYNYLVSRSHDYYGLISYPQ